MDAGNTQTNQEERDMSYTLTKEFRFEAAHKLPLHRGKCQRLHGHSFRFRLILKGNELWQKGSETGMLEDFGTVSGVATSLVVG